eukprot:gene21914-28373_t
MWSFASKKKKKSTSDSAAQSNVGPPSNHAPIPILQLARGISEGSKEVFSVLEGRRNLKRDIEADDSQVIQGSPRAVLLALFALKFAHRSGRISEEEKFLLKQSLTNNSILSNDAFIKLSNSEQTAFTLGFSTEGKVSATDFDNNQSTHQIIHLAELNMAERFELEKYRRQSALLIQSSSSKEDPALLSCQICGDDNLAASAGLLCPQLVEESKHFLCDGCITSYVNSLNNDPADSFFHQREGKIPCPVPCAEGSLVQCGAIFSNGDICKHVTDSKVLDSYIERLQYFQKIILVADYTEQLVQNLEEVKRQASDSGGEIDRKRKLLQLQQLAENIRLYCPDARQCANCGWGPILLDSKCDRLSDHHLQQHSGGGVYDNSCRQCGVRAELKSSLPLWDGKLPQSLT